MTRIGRLAILAILAVFLAVLAFAFAGSAPVSTLSSSFAAVNETGPVDIGAVRATALLGTSAQEHATDAATPEATPANSGLRSERRSADEVARATNPRALLVPRGSPLTVVRDENDVELAIVEAAREWNVDGAKMLALAWCESRFDPNAIGDGGLALSVFQWHATTWRQYAPALDYEVRDIFDVVAQARLTSWAIANGHGRLWACWR